LPLKIPNLLNGVNIIKGCAEQCERIIRIPTSDHYLIELYLCEWFLNKFFHQLALDHREEVKLSQRECFEFQLRDTHIFNVLIILV